MACTYRKLNIQNYNIYILNNLAFIQFDSLFTFETFWASV